MNNITRCAVQLYRAILADRAIYFKHTNIDLFSDISALRESLTCIIITDHIGYEDYVPIVGKYLDNHKSSIWHKFQVLLKYVDEEDEVVMKDVIDRLLLACREVQGDG